MDGEEAFLPSSQMERKYTYIHLKRPTTLWGLYGDSSDRHRPLKPTRIILGMKQAQNNKAIFASKRNGKINDFKFSGMSLSVNKKKEITVSVDTNRIGKIRLVGTDNNQHKRKFRRIRKESEFKNRITSMARHINSSALSSFVQS